MGSDSFLEAVESATETALGRLASSKSLIALTDASLDRGSVMVVAAGRERAAAEAYGGWSESADDPAGSTFADVAARHRSNLESILDLHDESEAPAASTDPMHASLANAESDLERAAMLVGRSLVEERVAKQFVGFFINEADQVAADRFRAVRESMNTSRDDGLELLSTLCESDDDWNRAVDMTTATIQAAYDQYVDTLEGMGVNPKPVC